MSVEVQNQDVEIQIGSDIAILPQEGPKLRIERKEGKLVVKANLNKYKSERIAMNAALTALVKEQAKIHFVRQDLATNLKFLSDNPIFSEVLMLQRLKNTRTQLLSADPQVFQPDFENLSNQKAFKEVCKYFAIYQKLPIDAPEEIKKIFQEIPQSSNGLHMLSEICSQAYDPTVDLKLYQYIRQAEKKAKELDQSTSEKFEYKPQVGSPNEEEPIDPSSIETKVTRFYGGYYRGYACKYDTSQHQIVQLPKTISRYESEQEAKEGEEQFLYETVFNENEDNNLELPYDAVIDSTSITPGYAIFRADSGSYYLQQNKTGSLLSRFASRITKITNKKDSKKVSFKFNIEKGQKLKDEPEDEPEVWGEFDQNTNEFIEDLKNDQSSGQHGKVKKVIKFVRQKLEYPEDGNAREAMNIAYLAAGTNSLNKVCTQGIADCYWSNIFAGQILARLGIQHRVIAGHYIQKDPRFDFAAVAGTGHAWSEWWNGTEWIREDATPAKENDEQEEQEEQEPQEGDFGDQESEDDNEEEPQEELSPEQISEIVNQLLNKTTEPPPPTPEQLFETEKGVSLAKWRAVESYITKINNTPVPAANSIDGKPSTIEREWKMLFDIIYERRKVPTQVYRGPVTQSEGDYLDDAVDAYIDVLTGEDDPSGYKKHFTKEKEQVFTKEFEDDAILDLTQSMSGTPAEEQRKMLLSGLYNLMNLNRRLNLSKFKTKMKAPVHLRSTVSVFKGSTLVRPLQHADQDIDEKTLCTIFDELEQLAMGSGNLVGALQAYENALTEDQLKRIKAGKLTKVLTVVTDGQVGDQATALQIIQRLREKGIIVNGIGFGNRAQDIKIVCNNPEDPEAAQVLTDLTQAMSTRHGMLTKALKKL